jgi:hypothetical protein
MVEEQPGVVVEESGNGDKEIRGNLNPRVLRLTNFGADSVHAEFLQQQLMDFGESHGSSWQGMQWRRKGAASANTGK